MSGLDHNSTGINEDIGGRASWTSALMALPREQLVSTVDEIAKEFNVRLIALPASGLGMLKFKDSALEQSFFLGEFPLSTASVELTLADDRQIQGAAQIMDDDSSYATSLAIADAVLAHKVSGYEVLIALVLLGKQNVLHEQTIRNSMLTRTKVDFSLLSMADGDDDEL